MSSQGKRIGFLLASIHTGSSLNLWNSIVHDMSKSQDSFFVFPGGRLNLRTDSEYQRNSIYALANKHNLDGLISWGSSIGSAVTLQELNRFHDSFGGVPYVTIAHKMPGKSCIQFDAYTGMSRLVEHFISVHGCSKIAFLRGPAFHASATERYRAFCDTMAKNGIKVKKTPLVTDPFSWTDGEKAVKQLCEDRKLEPGRDFEVIIGSSDMMTFSAVSYLLDRGYSVPQDFLCAGFNDSPESRILPAAFTTVHLPYSNLALTAIKMIQDQIDDTSNPGKDYLLDMDLTIRESCSCSFPFLAEHEIETELDQNNISLSNTDLIKELSQLFRLDKVDENSILEPLVSVLEQGNITLFFNLFEKVLERFFLKNYDLRLLFKSLKLTIRLKSLPSDFFQKYRYRILQLIPLVQSRIHERLYYSEQELNKKLNSFKCDLLSARSKKELILTLYTHFPLLDINKCALVLNKSEDQSLFIGGFTRERIYIDELHFSSIFLLPETISGFTSGVFVVQSLYVEKEPFGYFVCSATTQYDGLFYEELRSAISSALSAIFLFEQMLLAKQKAEEATESKTKFFANVGSDLIDPLDTIESHLINLEKFISQVKDFSLYQELLSKAQTTIRKHKENTVNIIDITLSQTKDLQLDRTLLHLDELLGIKQVNQNLPLIFADSKRLLQSLLIFSEHFMIDVQSFKLKRTETGLEISIIENTDFIQDMWHQKAMVLAESILLLHGASLNKIKQGVVILFPWPRFSCENAEKEDSILEWDTDSNDVQQWSFLYAEKDDPSFSQSAFLCITSIENQELALSKTFSAFFERTIYKSIENPILFIGKETAKYPLWAPAERCMYIPSLDFFAQTIDKFIPSIIVVDSLCIHEIQVIRSYQEVGLLPILILTDEITEENDIKEIMNIPRVILCNTYIAQSNEFARRVFSLLSGDQILPADTGSLVKKAILFFNLYASSNISRWKLADFVHVSEDYLTRIFHKEIGLSPWEYLTRYRIYLSIQLLLHTNNTVYDIAEKCGFQDQAYFCRVFKKITGFSTGQYKQANQNQI